MRILLISCLVLFTSLCLGQQRRGTELTIVPSTVAAIENASFFVDSVIDNRLDTLGIGVIQRGISNVRFTANFEHPFEEEILRFYRAILPFDNKKTPIIVRINELFITEETKAFNENGYAYVYLDLFQKDDQERYLHLGSYKSLQKNDKFAVDVSGKHDERITQALKECILQFQQHPSETTLVPLETLQVTSVPEENLLLVNKGFYGTYAELIQDIVIPVGTAQVNPNTERDFTEKLFITDTLGTHSPYFIYHDGTHFYVNAKAYSKGAYFVKTYRVGDLLIFNDRMSTQLLFGKSGMTSDAKRDVHFFDIQSARFYRVSKSNMKTLLKDRYPKLYKQYLRNGKKDIESTIQLFQTLLQNEDPAFIRNVLLS